MDGLMMDFQLTIPTLLRRAEAYFGDKEIVTRLPDKSFHRYTYADMARRAKQLAVALGELGLERGDRVATLSWNHYQHLEAYFGIPCGGFVLHTLNIRLHPNDIGYIAAHAGDRALIVDASLAPLVDQFRDQTQIEHVLVVEDSYEELLASADPNDWVEPELDENEAAAMCYTSGTTGMPKGVVYSHRSTILHTLGVAAANPLGVGIAEQDSLLPVVPMFHANAWGYPYLAAMVGTKLVFPGPHLDPESLLDDFVQEAVTWTAGVPTIWLGILQLLDANPGRWDLSCMKGMLVGGSAAPRAMIAGFKERHNLVVCHGWGMTETSPVASVAALPGEIANADDETKFDYLAMQGIPLALVELRARDDAGNEIPRDGETMGELEVRGPWVASAYYETPEQRRPLDGRRLVQDGRHRLVRSTWPHPDQGPVEGRDQVGRRVDLVGRPRERVDGASRGRGGSGDRDSGREVGRAAACRSRAEGWGVCNRGGVARVPRAAVREVVAAGSHRVRDGDPEDGGRQVPEDSATRPVRAATRRAGHVGGGSPQELGGDTARGAAHLGDPRLPQCRAG